MSVGWKDMTLQDFVTIYRQNRISDNDYIVLQRFYLPIIGTHAFSVYMLFSQFIYTSKVYHLTHNDILRTLNINIHDYYHARLRLEAIGLFKTYQNTTENDIEKYIIELIPPKSTHQFLSDAIFCGLLVDRIGETAFNQLKDDYTKPLVSLDGMHCINADFYKVYGKNLSLHSVDDNSLIADQTGELYAQDEQFDWGFFQQLLGQTYVDVSLLDSDVKNAIQVVYQLYQLSPIDMKEIVLRSHNTANNTINVDTLYRLARQMTQLQYKTVKSNTNQTPLDQLMVLFKQTKSSDFLKMIKASKNKQHPLGQRVVVDTAELKLLERLVVQQNVPMPVVNVLIHHLLVTLDMSELVEKYVTRTANDWIKQHIITPEDAMSYLKTRADKKDQSKGTIRQSKAVKKIELTESEKQALHDVDTPMSDEKRRQILGKLR